MAECDVCCENMNKSTRKPIKCHLCEQTSCMSCFKKYLCQREIPECMFCRKQFSLSFVAQVTTKAFHNCEYRKCRASILKSKERSLLPETQNYILEIKERDKFYKEKKEKLNRLKEEEESLKALLEETRESIKRVNIERPGKKCVERRKFTMACPDPKCRGFLSERWKCGVCDKYVCKECHVIKNSNKDEEHICKKDDVETAKMIMKETKGCPKCGVRIFKIDGCDQMWCVECKTPFSWKTGKIVKGVIHNPHFYQWQRKMNDGVIPRNPRDNLCGLLDNEIPSWYSVKRALRKIKCDLQTELISDIHRFLSHVYMVELPKYQDDINQVDRYKDLRVKYLLNKIDEHAWEKTLKQRQKKSEKNKELLQIFEMFSSTLRDIFIQFVKNPKKEVFSMFENLRNYANEEFYKIGKIYANNIIFIECSWFLCKLKK